MKVVRQIRLSRRDGAAVRVYEVDLCEVGPDRFVVNFRTGRQGGALQEGSRTPVPVAEAAARAVYERLVAERTAAGFVEDLLEGPGPRAPESADDEPDEPPVDPHHARLRALLEGEQGWAHRIEQVLWRAGELRARFAAPAIAAVNVGRNDRRAWHVARALLRCGDPATADAVRALGDDRADWVLGMARHALIELAEPTERQALLDAVRATIPAELQVAVEQRAHAAAVAALAPRPALLDALYLTADRQGFLALLERVSVQSLPFLGVRRVWAAAEARGDGEVWGLLVRRIERERRAGGDRPSPRTRGAYVPARGPTRKYLRRRGWRTLRRLGEAGMGAEYCRMAAGLLLAYRDEHVRSGDGSPFPGDWAVSHVLFHRSPRFRPNVRHLTWQVRAFGAAHGREEAFPELWDDAPEVLSELLDRSRCREVHAFAARALRANRDAWGRIPVQRLVAWFSAPYPETTALAAEVAVTRYDPADPDLALVQALLDCDHAAARSTAEGWVRSNPRPFLRDPRFVTGLVLSVQPATRRLALEVLTAASLLPAQAAGVVEDVVTAVLRWTTADVDAARTELLRDAATILASAFGPAVAALPIERVAALIRHPVEGVAELGARILLGHRLRPAELPDDLLASAMTSPWPVVRGIGVRLYGELPDAVLAERFRVLVHLVINPHADVRAAVRPIVVRLASANPGFAKVLLAGLVPLLVGDGAEGMHRDVVHLVRTDLAHVLPSLPAALVFRLLRATEPIVQELGGELLRTNVDPSELTPAQLAILASSDVLTVRRTAWLLLASQVEAVRAAPEAVVPLLEARWEDSRTRAFAFVEQQVGVEHLPPEVVLAVCDSVRPEVQALGRRLVGQRFEHADGWKYLARLAQHPSTEMQGFAASWLESHAAGNPDRIEALAPFFVTVLASPNRGRLAKLRVLAFLDGQLAEAACARLVAAIASELVLTVAGSHQARYVAMLAEIRRLHPDIPTPLRTISPEVRGAV